MGHRCYRSADSRRHCRHSREHAGHTHSNIWSCQPDKLWQHHTNQVSNQRSGYIGPLCAASGMLLTVPQPEGGGGVTCHFVLHAVVLELTVIVHPLRMCQHCMRASWHAGWVEGQHARCTMPGHSCMHLQLKRIAVQTQCSVLSSPDKAKRPHVRATIIELKRSSQEWVEAKF